MIEINLLPEEFRKKEPVKITMPEIPIKKTLFVCSGGLLALQLIFTIFTFSLHVQEISLTQKITAMKEASKEIIGQKAETSGMHGQIKEIRAIVSRKFSWAQLLSAVSNSMTKGVWLRNLSVTDEGPKSMNEKQQTPQPDSSAKKVAKDLYLVLEGSAVGQGQETAFIGKYLKQIKEASFFNELFSEIKPHNINQRRFKDFDVYDFMIYCKFRKEKTG